MTLPKDPKIFLSACGLLLDIAGVIVLFWWPPRGYIPVHDDATGRVQRIETGSPRDTWLARTALALLVLGFALQFVGVLY